MDKKAGNGIILLSLRIKCDRKFKTVSITRNSSLDRTKNGKESERKRSQMRCEKLSCRKETLN